MQYQVYTHKHIDKIPQINSLPSDLQTTIKVTAQVLPFRVNQYVLDQLIDWSNVPEDPLFQLTFPQRGMLDETDFSTVREMIHKGVSKIELYDTIQTIRLNMNPHPGNQMEMNIPKQSRGEIDGLQHKYRETVLFFPSQGQTCHAYCTYCFRWAQFVGIGELKFASREADQLHHYVRNNPHISDILITGGDPMVMNIKLLKRYILPLLKIEHVNTIRIGTKSVAWWPYRFVTDKDADDVLRLFEQVRSTGKHLALMAHYSHYRELETDIARQAIDRILGTGAVIRTQAPLIRHVNNHPAVWSRMWRNQVNLGAVPYYQFMERDTGPKNYFEVPLSRALEIYQTAFREQSGLGRTARGPVMSSTPGKVLVDGVANIHDEKVFVLKFLQGRHPEWSNQVFFAKYDDQATWLSDLSPAFGKTEFFFEKQLEDMKKGDAQSVHKEVESSYSFVDDHVSVES